MQVVGWLSSFVLLLTILNQIHKQWSEDTSKGVSPWLYGGQLGSECGFVAYSWSTGDWVFVVTNTLLLLSNCLGLAIVLRHKRRAAGRAKVAGACPTPQSPQPTS